MAASGASTLLEDPDTDSFAGSPRAGISSRSARRTSIQLSPRTVRLSALAGFAIALSSPGLAQDPQGFSGRIALGYLATSGNSESESLNTSFDLSWTYDPWEHSLAGRAINASTSGVTTAEAHGLEWQSRYAVNDTDYVFGLAALDDDGFSAYDRQVRASLGYGRRFVDRPRHVLNGEAGLGARQADLRDLTPQDDTILRLALDYGWTLSETSEFSQSVVVDSGSENTYLEAESVLSAEIREDLALVLSYTIQRNSEVPPDSRNTDTFTAISLEYSF